MPLPTVELVAGVTLLAMSRRFHLVLGCVAMLIGLVAAIAGIWWSVAAMALLIAGQVIGYRNAEH